MDTSRRQFLVGLASGLILPKFCDSTCIYLEGTSEAPLMKLKVSLLNVVSESSV